MMDLQDCRNQIDQIDKEIARLFHKRMGVSSQVAENKRATGKKIYDKSREDAILEKLGGLAENEFEKHCYKELFSQIMSMSRKLQYSLLTESEGHCNFDELGKLEVNDETKVVYLGPEASYTSQAMEDCFGKNCKSFPASNFKEIMEIIKEGKADYGVLPIENTSTGGITDIYDLLASYDNYIVGEHVVKIEHALLGIKGSKIEEIETVYSHQQGIRQCKEFLEAHPNMKCVELDSTALGAKKVSVDQLKTQASITSKRAADYYGLEVLAEHINSNDQNATRFIIVTNKKIFLSDANKVSICFVAPHISGALYNILSHMIFNNLNMTKIESRPLVGKSFEYRFFVDFEGNLNSPAVKNTLNGIAEEAIELKVLGNYSTK